MAHNGTSRLRQRRERKKRSTLQLGKLGVSFGDLVLNDRMKGGVNLDVGQLDSRAAMKLFRQAYSRLLIRCKPLFGIRREFWTATGHGL